eukprot:Hpha_TRINITY_DN13458_c0_g1::TRINITY_DN13458_c0_g1_i1::g.130790::m.130790
MSVVLVRVAFTYFSVRAAATAEPAAARVAPAAAAGHVTELVGGAAPSLLHEFHELLGVLRVPVFEEGVGITLVTCTPGTTDTVHVVLHRAGEVEVDNHGQVTDVETTRRDVSGDEDGRGAATELVKCTLTLVLLLVTVDGIRRVTTAAEVVGDLVGPPLGVGEHKHLCEPVLLQLPHQVHDALVLLVPVAEYDVLRHVRVRCELETAHLDLHPVPLVVAGQALHLLRPRRRPHQRLPVRADLPHNLPDLRFETHVKHAVRLVHDEVRHPHQVEFSALQEVNQTPWRSNADLHTVAQLPALRPLGRTAVAAHTAELALDLRDLLMDLSGQLAGGSEDKHHRPVAPLERLLRHDVNQPRHTEREGLTTTGLRNTDHVPAAESGGPALSLDHGRGSVTGAVETVENVLWEGTLLEGHNRLRHVAPEYLNLIRLAPSLNFLGGAGLDVARWLVEVLLHLDNILPAVVNVAQPRPKRGHPVPPHRGVV